jgi:hypothetical protein
MNKPYYIGGEKVIGRVELNLNSSISASGIHIKFKGKEQTFMRVVTHGKHRQTHHYQGKHEILKVSSLLAALSAPLGPGKHSWDFTYQLPAGIPSCCYVRHSAWDDLYIGAIMYDCKAWVDMAGSNIKSKIPLVITEPVSTQILPVSEKKIKSFAFAKGKLEYSAELGKDVFTPGESAPVRIKVVNPTKKDVKHIKVRLVMKCRLSGKSMALISFGETQIPFSHYMTNQVFDGVKKGVDLDVILPADIPANSFPTANGKIVRVSYELSIQCDLPWAFDLNIHPKIQVALLPAPNVEIPMFTNYPGFKKAFPKVGVLGQLLFT